MRKTYCGQKWAQQFDPSPPALRGWLQELIDHLRHDIGKVEDPRAEALLETSAEVLGGLQTAFKHYEEKTEEAWQAN